MAAHAGAVAQHSWDSGALADTFIVCFLNICTKHSRYCKNSQAELLIMAYTCSPDKNYWDFIPPEIRRSPGSGESIISSLRRHRLRRHRKHKRSKRGLMAKLKASPHKPAIPSLFPANVRSVNIKMDALRLRSAVHSLDYCALMLTETWLDQNIPDAAIQLAVCTVTRVDSKSKGGGLCIFTPTAPRTLNTYCCSADLSCLCPSTH